MVTLILTVVMKITNMNKHDVFGTILATLKSFRVLIVCPDGISEQIPVGSA